MSQKSHKNLNLKLRTQQWVRSFVGVLFVSCAVESPLPPEQACSTSSPQSRNGFSLIQSGDVAQKPNFEDDIVPIISSVESGRVYKCTVCHSAYKTPGILANVEKINKVLDEMKARIASSQKGVVGMPIGDDTSDVQQADIAKIEAWRDAGFPLTKADATNSNPTAPGTKPTTTNPFNNQTGQNNGGQVPTYPDNSNTSNSLAGQNTSNATVSGGTTCRR